MLIPVRVHPYRNVECSCVGLGFFSCFVSFFFKVKEVIKSKPSVQCINEGEERSFVLSTNLYIVSFFSNKRM